MPVFLKDVGNQIRSDEHEIYDVKNFKGIPQIYVVVHDLIGDFLIDSSVYGKPRAYKIQDVFNCLTAPDEIKALFKNKGNILQLLPMKSGEFCNLQKTFDQIPPYDEIPLSTWYAEIQRRVAGDQVIAQCASSIKEWGDVTCVIISDTCGASGSTFERALHAVLQMFKNSLEQVFIVSACTSWQGLARAHKICEGAKINLTAILGQCIFQTFEGPGVLGLEWTDLPIISSGTITTEKYYNIAKDYHCGRSICAVGDVGSSIRDPKEFLSDRIKEMYHLEMPLNDFGWKWIIAHYLKMNKSQYDFTKNKNMDTRQQENFIKQHLMNKSRYTEGMNLDEMKRAYKLLLHEYFMRFV